jgi:mRNA interferase MazF
MVMPAIRQGDLFWVDLGIPIGSEPGYRHPVVVVQNDALNESRLGTIVACAITSNLRHGAAPGNVTLRAGEAGLPKACVVTVSHLLTLDKSRLVAQIGSLAPGRVRQILDGIHLILEPSGDD